MLIFLRLLVPMGDVTDCPVNYGIVSSKLLDRYRGVTYLTSNLLIKRRYLERREFYSLNVVIGYKQ